MKSSKYITALLLAFSMLLALLTLVAGCRNNPDENLNDPIYTDELVEIPDYLLKYPDYVPDYLDDEVNRQPYSYSEGRNENGYWENISALKYVDMFKYIGMEIPGDVHTVTDWDIEVRILGLLDEYDNIGLYDLTDEIVTECFEETYGWTTIEQMKEELRERIFYEAIFEYFTDYISENVTVTIPEYFMEIIEERMIEFRRQEAADNDMDFSEYISDFFLIEDGIRGLVESTREGNMKTAHIQLVFQALAEDMGLIVTDADMEDYYISHKVTNRESMVEIFGLPNIKQQVMNYMIVNYIIENAIFLELELEE